MLAAIAKAKGLTLITRNVSDFIQYSGNCIDPAQLVACQVDLP
jgi:predicted nucleic acid-binding protein